MRSVNNKKTREKHFIIFTNKDAEHEGIWLDLDSTNSVYKSYDGDECIKGEISNLKIPGEEKNLGGSVKLTKCYRNLENNYFKINKTIQTVIETTDEDLEMMTSGLADIALDIRKSSPSKGIKNTDYKAIKTKCANIHKKNKKKQNKKKKNLTFLKTTDDVTTVDGGQGAVLGVRTGNAARRQNDDGSHHALYRPRFSQEVDTNKKFLSDKQKLFSQLFDE